MSNFVNEDRILSTARMSRLRNVYAILKCRHITIVAGTWNSRQAIQNYLYEKPTVVFTYRQLEVQISSNLHCLAFLSDGFAIE